MTPTDELRETILPVHHRILEHPFLTGMTDGTLPEEAFARYVVQDALFLVEYARALALCAARAPEAETLRMFCSHATEAIDVERDLHDRLMADLGIEPPDVDTTLLTPTTLAYGSFLVSACAVRDRHEALAAMVPCYWIYREVGLHLVESGSPDPRYQQWIDTYAGEEFIQAVEGALHACNRASAHLDADQRRSANAHALTAARYEWMFWDSALRFETWPV